MNMSYGAVCLFCLQRDVTHKRKKYVYSSPCFSYDIASTGTSYHIWCAVFLLYGGEVFSSHLIRLPMWQIIF